MFQVPAFRDDFTNQEKIFTCNCSRPWGQKAHNRYILHLANSPWDVEAVRQQRIELIKLALKEREIILCIDETGDKKKGKSTDYVARQYDDNPICSRASSPLGISPSPRKTLRKLREDSISLTAMPRLTRSSASVALFWSSPDNYNLSHHVKTALMTSEYQTSPCRELMSAVVNQREVIFKLLSVPARLCKREGFCSHYQTVLLTASSMYFARR